MGVNTLRDPVSGLLNGAYFDVAVPDRVSVARRGLRPLSLVLMLCDVNGLSPRERGAIVVNCLRDADTACQLDHDIIGLILDDTAEDGAVWTAERLRQELECAGHQLAVPAPQVQAGIATYPEHTLDAAELVFAARQALVAAMALPGSRIEIAHQSLS